MTWGNRLRLWVGILMVLAVTIGLTLVVNQRERQAFSSNATVEAVQYQVGSDYGGIMVDQYVEPDAEVREGEKMFTISSFALQKDLANGLEPVSTSAYDLDATTGLVTYLASADGTLGDFEARQGGYVPGGETMAVITEEGTAYVEAQFRLEPVDYARIQIGSRADVELPNRQVLRGEVSAISVETWDGVAFTTVQIQAPELREDDLHAFAQPGSPVAVTLILNDDGILAGPTDTAHGVPAPGGRALMRRSFLAAVALMVGLLAACSSSSTDETAGSAQQGEGTTSPPSEADVARATKSLAPLVEQMPELSLAPLPDLRLAESLTPPTNRWFSGLVFGEEPQPVFPLPLTFGMDDSSFGFGLPQIVTTTDHIVGSNQQDVNVNVEGGATTLVSAYDVASVTLETIDGEGEPLGRTTIAEGSPFITHVAAAPETLTTSVPFTGPGDVATADTSTGTWGVRLRDAQLDAGAITLAEGGSAVFFPVPADGSAEELAAYAAPLTETAVSFAVETAEVATELTYTTAEGQPTAHGVLPHQFDEEESADCTLGTFPTVYGQLTLCPGNTLRWSAPRIQATAELDLSGLHEDQRSELATSVGADVAALPDAPADTYFGGKHAYRTAQLLSIASQVGAADAPRGPATTHRTDAPVDPDRRVR